VLCRTASGYDGDSAPHFTTIADFVSGRDQNNKPTEPDLQARQIKRQESLQREAAKIQQCLAEHPEDLKGPSGSIRKSNRTDNESAKMATSSVPERSRQARWPTGHVLQGQSARCTVEPVSGNLRHNKRLNRFTLRGRRKVDTQWKLYCLVHTIEKLMNNGTIGGSR
jgi:Transposase DDE domain